MTSPRVLLAVFGFGVLATQGMPSRVWAIEVDFNRTILPILAEHCFQCHGPDAGTRSADLRLDTYDDAVRSAIVPGDPDASPVIHRLFDEDPELVMPPPKSGKSLTWEQKTLLKEWIRNGARYSKHWAFEPIRNADVLLTEVGESLTQDLSPIDQFLYRRLNEAGLHFAPEVSKEQFIRRASFDLIGLPPSPEEIQAYLADEAPGHRERLIDRLLDSPRYGERWGRHWLDLARYADTHGGAAIGFTRFPFSYTYRDYVIRTLNEDRPLDRFIIEQIAADQLGLETGHPDLAALGFLTVGMQFRNPNDTLDDQIDVITRGLMGLTVACARCHDHKFDPITTEDYYALYASVSPSKSPDELPIIGEGADPNKRAEYDSQFSDLRTKVQHFVRDQSDVLRQRLRMQIGIYLREIAKGLPEQDTSTQFLSYRTDDLRPIVYNRWREYLLQMPRKDPVFGLWLETADAKVADPDAFQAKCLEIADRMKAELDAAGFTPEKWHALREETPRWNPLILEAVRETKPRSMIELADLYGKVFADEHKQWMQALLDASLEAAPGGTIVPDEAAQHQVINSPTRRQLRHYLYGRGTPTDLTDDEAARLTNRTISDMIGGKRGAIHQLNLDAPGAPPRAMALQETPSPRETHVMLRGNPLARGNAVAPRFLSLLSPGEVRVFQDGKRRLGLARAVVAPDNPLTRRVLVNWVWQNHFGTGLIRTPDDLGTRGQPPTHPELLDYLADRLSHEGWSLKWLHREIMRSRAYRQGAIEITAARNIDPENLLLWRMPRRRLDFEAMRDAMLKVSGELDTSMGGRPIDLEAQPAIPRRSVYGFINRDVVANLMSTFDVANPNACTARRPETTVPQQTLFALNSEFIQDRAKRICDRSREAGSATPTDRVQWLFQQILGRRASEQEIATVLAFVNHAGEVAEGTSVEPATIERKWEHLAHALLASNEFTFLD